mgnify:CR=1 FL=1
MGLVLLLALVLVLAWVMQIFIDALRLGYAYVRPYNLTAGGYFEEGVSFGSTWGFNAFVGLAVIVVFVLVILGAAALRREE